MTRQKVFQNLFYVLLLISNSLQAQFVFTTRKVPFPDAVRPVYASSMIEDKHNNIWVSFIGYVMRYDGNNFQTYDYRGGGMNTFSSLLEDPNTGMILLFTNTGLFKIIGDSIHPYQLPIQLKGRSLKTMQFDHDKRLWLAGKDFLAVGTYNDTDFTYRFEVKKANDVTDTWFVKNKSSFFVSRDNIIYKVNGERLEKYYEFSKKIPSPRTITLAIAGRSDLLLNDGNLLRVRENGKTELIWKNPEINSYYPSWSDERFIVYGNDTLNFIYDDKLVLTIPPEKSGLKGRTRILRTRDGSFWIADLTGFYCIRLTNGYDITPRMNEEIISYSFSNHRLWLGTYSGKLYESQGGYSGLSAAYTDIKKRYPGYLTSNISDVFFSGEKLYLATEHSGLIEYTNEHTPVNRYINLEKNGKVLYLVTSMQTADKTIYASSIGKIVRLKDQKTTVIADTLIAGGNYIFNIQEDQTGALWIKSEKGLFCQKNGVIFRPKGLPENITVTSLEISKNNLLILTTLQEGLIFYDPTSQKITKRLRKENALLTDKLGTMIKDQNENLWINTEMGLFILKYPYSKNDIMYPPFSGKGRDFFLSPLFMDGDSMMIEHENRFLKIPTKKMLDEAHPYLPKLYIVRSKIKNYSGIMNGFNGWTSPVLDYKQNSLNFQISTNQKIYEPSPIYEYYLKGAEDPFSNKTLSGEISYAGLAPGNYELIIRVSNANTQTPELRLPFVILKPWYQRWYMMLLYLLLFTALLFIIINREYRIKARKNREEKQLIESELKAIRAQLNPHFVQNLFVSIVESFHAKPFGDAVSGVQRISDFVRQVLYKTEHATQSLEEELEFTEKYIALEQMTRPGLFTYQVSIDDNVDTFGCTVPSLLLQPFIENSIKHGFINMKGGGVIMIKVMQNENFIEIVIADNGVGFHQSEEKKAGYLSKGWIISLKRLKLIAGRNAAQADIKVLPRESYLGGAAICICIPLVYESRLS